MRLDLSSSIDAAHQPGLRGAFLRFKRRKGKKLLYWFFHSHVKLRVEGLEHIPKEGPLLILPNHLSNLDGPLLLALFPGAVEMVGPGDFKVEFMKLLMMKVYGMTLIKRGYADKAGMDAILHHLKAGRRVLMFPSGGMWEKRTFENKTGPLYFSQLTKVPMLPAGISGAYLQGRPAFFFAKPSIVIRFGPPMEAVSKTGSKAVRLEALEKASRELADRIFSLLEPDEQEQYRRWEREEYRLEIDAHHSSRVDEKAKTLLNEAHSFPTLAQFIHKPNLFRPMWKHARKNMDPFRIQRYYSIRRVIKSAEDLKVNLTGAFDHYIPYRLGEDAYRTILEELDRFLDLSTGLKTMGVRRLRCITISRDPETGEERRRAIRG